MTIQSEDEYKTKLAKAEALIVKTNRTPAQSDELSELVDEIEAYEHIHYPI